MPCRRVTLPEVKRNGAAPPTGAEWNTFETIGPDSVTTCAPFGTVWGLFRPEKNAGTLRPRVFLRVETVQALISLRVEGPEGPNRSILFHSGKIPASIATYRSLTVRSPIAP